MGNVKPKDDTFKETTIRDDKELDFRVVEVVLEFEKPVDDASFDYLING